MKAYNFDSLKFATEGLTGFGCTVIQDDINLPSFMIPINKRTNAQLFTGGSEKTHSAFLVDDVEYKRFFASKFVNCIINGRAYSWPGMDPAAVINFDNSMAACNAKGAGWHMLSIAERAVINHLIHKSGFEPRGNTQYGKNHAYTYEVGEQTADEGDGSGGRRTTRTATGSGPATWFSDGTREGIADWVGNVWKWISGMRIVDGKIQIMNQNMPAKQVSHAAVSTYWKEILPSGALVDPGAAGTLAYTADFKVGTATGAAKAAHMGNFANMGAVTGLTIPEILFELFLAPKAGKSYTGGFWLNNEGERLPFVGGGCNATSLAGSSALNVLDPRSFVDTYLGFFSAFLEL